MTYTDVSVSDKKYTIRIWDDGRMEAFRYGEKWQDLTGNKMIYCLAYELNEARQQLKNAQE